MDSPVENHHKLFTKSVMLSFSTIVLITAMGTPCVTHVFYSDASPLAGVKSEDLPESTDTIKTSPTNLLNFFLVNEPVGNGNLWPN